jgi:hypothetical protein
MEEMSMQFPNGMSRSALLWGIGISAGLLLFAFISVFHGTHAPLEDTFKNIVKKSEMVSQMRIDLLKSIEMEKNAVMAVTDEESQEFANQAITASAAVDTNLKVLRSLVEAIPFQDEKKLIDEFNNCWTELCMIDSVILELAVQNTNLKAAILSRENGSEAMRRFESALEYVMRSYSGTQNEARVTRLSYRAITAGLKLYNMHISHIAEASDEKMNQIETQMKVEENEVFKALDELAGIVGEKNRDTLLLAKEAFSEFKGVTAEVLKLSRQNSNIKSLDLSLTKKRKIAAVCDEILAAFQKAVQNRSFRATR